MTIGYKIQRLRHMIGLTQRGLARLSGISQPAIAHIEVGRHEPRAETLEALMGVLMAKGCPKCSNSNKRRRQ